MRHRWMCFPCINARTNLRRRHDNAVTQHICVECGECPQGIYDYEEEPLEVALDTSSLQPSRNVSNTTECVWCRRHNVRVTLDSPQCVALQLDKGCHACDDIGCWRTNPSCTFYGRQRPVHADAPTSGMEAANMFERTPVRLVHNIRDASVSVILQGQVFKKGKASGVGCNCLIHTLLQCINDRGIRCTAAIPWIRSSLRERFPSGSSYVSEINYLDFRNHWKAVVDLIGISARHSGYDSDKKIYAHTFRVTAILEEARRVVEKDGDGHVDLFVLNEGNSHFVPLLRTTA